MFSLLQIAILFSSISFISYGSSCLFSQAMKQEFERYRLKKMRVLTGSLQIMASLVLLLGFLEPLFATVGSLFFSLMMFMALLVRLRIRDPLPLMVPAVIYLALNLYIFLSTATREGPV